MDFIVNLVTLALQNNNDNNIVSDDEENDVGMPPLVEVANQEVPSAAEPPTENPVAQSLYPVAMVNFDKNVDGKSVPPSLVNKDTGEVVDKTADANEKKEEKKPEICQKLIAQSEIVEIPEKLLKEIPYIESLLSGRFTISEEDGIVKSEEIDPALLKIILKYLESGKLFTLLASLPKEYDVLQLFELFRFLSVKPPICIKKDSIKKRLLEPPSIGLSSQQALIEYAFSIFYAFNLLNYRHENKIRNNIYNTMIFIYEKEHTSFKPRARFHLLELAKKCVHFSYNQFQKVRKFKVTDKLDDSDTESVASVDTEFSADDWFDDCHEFMEYLDPDLAEVMGFMDRFNDFDGYNDWYDEPDFLDSDDSDDSDEY